VNGVDWAGFALAVLLIELTPGPNMAWLAALSLGQGRRAGLAAVAGIAVGLFVNAMAAGLGAAALITAVPELWQVLRWGGVLFMLWLAWDSWREAGSDAAMRRSSPSSSRRHFLSGLTVNLLNPKALLFFLVLIPQFLRVQSPSVALVAAVALLSITIATAVHLAIVLTGSGLARWLVDPAKSRTVRRALALSLVGVAIWFAVGAKMPG
jgi:threonine/homoserine/homoserine lactone efflux protein